MPDCWLHQDQYSSLAAAENAQEEAPQPGFSRLSDLFLLSNLHTCGDLLVGLAAELLLGIPDEPLKVNRQRAFWLATLPDLTTERQQVILQQDAQEPEPEDGSRVSLMTCIADDGRPTQ